MKEDIAKTRSRTAELQVQANEETDHKQKTVEELTNVEAWLQESQNFLAESNKTHEVFMLEDIMEECEMDEEIMNAQLELQNSIVRYDRMVQETMTLVNESRQSFAQRIEMKYAALTACRNDFQSLTQQVEEASAEKHEMMKENIATTRSRTAELQVQANEETEHEQKTEEELTHVEACLQESQNSLAESNKTHKMFMLEVIMEECEMDEELMNAQLELQDSIISHHRMVQETMTLVNESRQSYAQHIEMKDAALTTFRNDFQSFTQQVEEASAEKVEVTTYTDAATQTYCCLRYYRCSQGDANALIEMKKDGMIEKLRIEVRDFTPGRRFPTPNEKKGAWVNSRSGRYEELDNASAFEE